MIRHSLRRQQRCEQFLGLPQTHTHRLAGHREAIDLLVADHDRLLELLAKFVAFGLRLSEFGSQPFEFVGLLFDAFDELVSVVVDGLSGAVGFFGPLGDIAVVSTESGDGIANPDGEG